MANWVADFLAANSGVVVAKRARRALHVREGDGFVAHCLGKPIHYFDNGWQPIDTALVDLGAEYGAAGIPVRIRPDGLIRVRNKAHRQQTKRIGWYTPATNSFSNVHQLDNVVGVVQGDSYVRTRGVFEHRLTLKEDGLRETLTINAKPVGNQNDWLVIETAFPARTFPNGWLEEFDEDDYHFPIPRGEDANGEIAPARRRARQVGGVQYVYTGLPMAWLDAASYPVVIDPDFEGDTADSWLQGDDATYATARSTATANVNSGNTENVGQNTGYTVDRTLLKFDTSSLGAGATINQVNLKLMLSSDYSSVDFDVQIVKQDWSAQDPITSGNRDTAFDNCLSGTADDSIWRNTSGISTDVQYESGNLDTTWPNKTGNSYYSLRSSRDYNNNTPTGLEFIEFYSSDNPVAARRPVLTVATPVSVSPDRGMLRGVMRGVLRGT